MNPVDNDEGLRLSIAVSGVVEGDLVVVFGIGECKEL